MEGREESPALNSEDPDIQCQQEEEDPPKWQRGHRNPRRGNMMDAKKEQCFKREAAFNY